MESKEAGTSKQNKPYIVPFRDEWMKRFPWLKNDGKSKICCTCHIPISGGLTHLSRHDSSENHKKKMSAAQSTPTIQNFLSSTTKCPTNESAKKLEIMVSAFVAEHNIPFNALDHLNCIIKEGINDSKIAKTFNINRKKGQTIVTNILGPQNITDISDFCKMNYFSIVLDESTDISINKNLAIVIRTFNGQCRDRFLGLIKIDDSSSSGIFESTLKFLELCNIPLNNIIGITTDNCAVMMGPLNGVQAKFKEKNPHIFTNGCICHILNLTSSAASKCGIPIEIDKFIKDINFHFCNSSSRREEFTTFQEYFGTELHVIYKYAATRWLSREEVVNRILEQWEPLRYYFTLNDFERGSRNERIEFIKSGFFDPVFKMTFLFLQYVLKIINSINIEMQSEDVRMHIFLPRLKYLFRQIARNFINKDILEKCSLSQLNINENHIPLDDIFCGSEVDLYLNTNEVEISVVNTFKENCKQFYIKFCEVLRKKVDFDSEMLIWFSKFSPENVLSGRTNSIIPLLLKMFPNERQNFENINSQYRALADVEELKPLVNENICSFWSKVAKTKNSLGEYMFSDISKIANGILSIPHSSANVERIFSYQNLIKTKQRNRLNVETVSSLIQTKDLLKSKDSCCYNFDISNKIMSNKL